jgi:hypothetical protein
MGFGFEWTVRAGDILTFIGGIFVAGSLLYKRGGQDATLKVTMKAFTDELAEMKSEFKSFGETLKKVAIQEMQIGLLMKWYDELRNGKGIVKDD